MKAYVINLDTRTDRWEWITSHLSKFQTIITSYEKFSAIKLDNVSGATGCWLSHQSLVKMAKSKNYDMILVLEDDCQLCDDFDKRFPAILNWLINNRDLWDVFNGGPAFLTNRANAKILDRNLGILKVGCVMAHFVIYNRSSYDTIINAGPVNIIDNFINQNLNQITIYPILARQIPSQSNAQTGYKDYNRAFDMASDLLKAIFDKKDKEKNSQ